MTEQVNTIANKKDNVFSFLKSRIVSGEYIPGYKFPSEPELSKELGVGRITLRAALDRLEKTGFVVRSPGKGTFVASEKQEKKGLKNFLALTYNPMGDIQHPTTYIMPSIIKTCAANDIDIDILSISFLRSLSEKHAFTVLDKIGYDGVILDGSFFLGTEKEVKILKALNKPVLIPHSKLEDNITTGFATMNTDYKQAWTEALRHIAEQGHKNILTLGALSNENKLSLRGFEEKEYLDFLAFEGINPDPGLLHFTPYNYTGLTKLLSEVFKLPQPPTAILCFSDFYAMNVYDSLNSLSIKIPEDVAVMGYCGYPGAHMMSPPLSTVDCEYAEIGKMAVEILNNSAEWFNKAGERPPHIISPHKLVVRESTRNKIG